MEAAERVIRSGRYILGPESQMFVQEFSEYLGVGHAIGVASGTDALALALTAAGVGSGDRVVTSPFTFFATAEAILRAGAEPVFVDIEPDTYNLDPLRTRDVLEGTSQIHRRLSIDPSTVRAVLPVHLFGCPADTDAFMRLAEEHGLVVVEDCAQALGAERSGRRVGTMGHAGCFSFFPTKNLGGLGDGGMVTTGDTALAESVSRLRAHGATAPYVHEAVGTNSRLDEIQAAFLRVKLTRLDSWIERRRAHASAYSAALAPVATLDLPTEPAGGTHSFHQYTVRIAGERRDDVRRHLEEHGIGSSVYYPLPLHLQPALRSLGYQSGDLPRAEIASSQVLSLPMFPELQDTEIQRVAETISRYLA